MTVRDSKGEGIGELVAHAQALYRRQCIVQGIGIIARGIHAERAVKARCIGLRHEAHHIMQIRVRRSRQSAADGGRILEDGIAGSGHRRRVIGAVNGHGQGI